MTEKPTISIDELETKVREGARVEIKPSGEVVEDPVDYRALLAKYIRHVSECTAIDDEFETTYLTDDWRRYCEEQGLTHTDADWAALTEVSPSGSKT